MIDCAHSKWNFVKKHFVPYETKFSIVFGENCALIVTLKVAE
jgi:hypothetical protein